jgi:flagellar biosynthesis/type III secretory pathway M-ring protein FliF/YscJ
MDVFKTQFENIRKQFGALTSSQKMLVVALIAVMALTLGYWAKFAGSPEMVSLMGAQALSDSEVAAIDDTLTTRDVPHTIAAGGKVMVPADRRSQALAQLMFEHKLPANSRTAFEEMSKSLNAFSTTTEREAVYTQALNKEMASVISGFPGVDSATVVINAKSERRVEGSVPPTAMVSITTKPGGGADVKKLVRAAADGLAGAVSELSAGHVSVIIDGTTMRVPDAGNNPVGQADDYVSLREKEEVDYEEKVRRQLQYIIGVTVTVNCDIDRRTQTSDQVEIPKDKVIQMADQEITRTEKTSNTPAVSKEPGVATNAGSNGPISIGNGGAGEGGGAASETSIETASSTYKILAPETRTHIETPAGKDTVVSAAIDVPLSYFQRVAHKGKTGAKDLSDADMDVLIKAETDKIRDKVCKAIGIKSADDLVVDMYVDAPPEVTPVPAAAPSAAVAMVAAHAKEIAVGLLAVVSLLMMAMMVRKTGAMATVMTPVGPMTIPINDGGPSPGQSGGGTSTIATAGSHLDGMELDDDDVRTQQMLEQVSTMVKENPDNAAALVKKWLTRS